MKKSILFTALAALLVATSCAGSDTSEQSTKQNSTEQTANPKKEAPERKGWGDDPLYGDIESVTITNYDVADKSGEIVRDKIII